MKDILSLDHLARMSNADLTRISSQITGRLNNEDWQQMIFDLRVSGHIHTFAEEAPLLLQRFIRLEVDLDNELAKRSYTAPLLSTIRLDPPRPEEEDRQRVVSVASQDAAAMMSLELNPTTQWSSMEFGFNVRSMLTLRFHLPNLEEEERRTFLNLLRRDLGITFLWTPERWEQDYLIFIKQDIFTRVYAFSHNMEATARMTNESVGTLTDWLERAWFPRRRRRRSTQAQIQEAPAPEQPKPKARPESWGTGALDPDRLKRIVQKLENMDASSDPASQAPSESAEDDPFTW